MLSISLFFCLTFQTRLNKNHVDNLIYHNSIIYLFNLFYLNTLLFFKIKKVNFFSTKIIQN